MEARLFGRALERERGQRTQSEFAASLEVDQSQLSKWERGETLPSTRTVAAIEARLGIRDGRVMPARQDAYYTSVRPNNHQPSADDQIIAVLVKHLLPAVEELRKVFADSEQE